MVRKILFSAVLIASFTVLGVSAQTGSVTGEVMDSEADEGLPGANVLVVETSQGVAANENGMYEIAGVEPGSYTLRASFTGYKTDEVQVTVQPGQETVANFELRPDVAELEEVVATGIASETAKSQAEVSVSRIDASELSQKNSNLNVADLISGKSPGVRVGSSAGSVGSGMRFKIRSGGGLKGSGQPAIYLDGTRLDNSEVEGTGAGGQGFGALSDLNPGEIENIDILKGPAAAALYGVEGSNGVVLIETKGGTDGETQVQYSSTIGQNEPHTEYSTEDYFTAEAANGELVSKPLYENQVSISGGNQSLGYYATVTHRNEKGIVLDDEIERTSFRANFDATPTENLSLSVNTSYTLNKQKRQVLDNGFGPLNNTIFISNEEIWSKTGSREAVYARNDVLNKNRFVGSVDLTWNPIGDLQVQANAGIDRSNMENNNVEPVGFSYGGQTEGQKEKFMRENRNYNFDANVRYPYEIVDGLSVNTIVGVQLVNEKWRSLFVEKQTFPAEPIMDFGSGEDFLGSSEEQVHERSAGIFASQEFNYQDTYFATMALRRDYSSAVGSEAPSIFYPKGSAAVRLDQFDATPDLFSFLKVRGAYGESGKLPQTLDAVDRLYGANNTGYGAGAVITRIGNNEIKPERVREFEVGFNSELLNRYTVDFTAYWTRARESIVGFDQAPSTGLTASAIPFNVGAVNGSGIEGSVGADIIRTEQHLVTSTVNWTYTTNEVQSLGRAQPIFDWNNVIKEGLPRAAFFPIQNNGALFNDDGTYAGADIDANKREFVGTPYPNHQGSFELEVTLFEDFDIYALTEWALDTYTHNATNQIAERYGNLPKRIKKAAKLPNVDRFKDLQEEKFPNVEELEPGTAEHRKVANEYAMFNPRSGKGYVEQSDWIALSQVSVGYDATDLIRQFTPPQIFESITFRVAANDAIFASMYSDPDPRLHWQGSRTVGRGRDFTSLQQPRTWTFKVNVQL
jgi:TonB-dependent SusC/RagA subfamily outer membrane receptor